MGYILTGEYNENKYDRTKWYSIVELAVLANGDNSNSQPIPDNKPDNKPDNRKISEEDEFINDLKSRVKLKSKVTKTKELKSLLKGIQDKEALKRSYILHQSEKGEYAKRITAYILDYEESKSNKDLIANRSQGGYTF